MRNSDSPQDLDVDGPTLVRQLRDRVSALEADCARLRRGTSEAEQSATSLNTTTTAQGERILGVGSLDWDETADRCIGCSPGMAALLGTEPADPTGLLNDTAAFLARLHPQDREVCGQALIRMRATRQRVDIEYRLMRGDEPVWIREVREPVVDDSGRLVRSRGYLRDISEMKTARHHTDQSAGKSTADPEVAQARLLDAIEGITEGFILFDAEEKLVFCNDRYRSMFPELTDLLTTGQPLETLVRARIQRGLAPQVTELTQEWLNEQLKGIRSQEAASYEFPIRDDQWVQLRARQTAEGGLVGIYTDITERKQVEIALAESEERLRLAAQLAGIGYCIWDSRANLCIDCSDEYAAIHGTDVEGFLKLMAESGTGLALTHPDDRDTYRNAIETLRREGTGFGLEYRVIVPDGEARHVRTIVKPVFDADGQVVQEYQTLQDITAQKQSEIALRNNQDLLMAIIDHAPAEIDVKDENGRFMLVNRQMQATLGIDRDKLIGRTSQQVLPPDEARICGFGDTHVLDSGEEIFGEVMRPTDDGPKYYLTIKFKIPQLAGNSAAIGRISTDITDLKQGERALREHQEILDTIMATAPVSITVKHPDSSYVYANRNELNAFNIETENYRGKTPFDLLAADIAEQIVTTDRMVVESGEALPQYEEQLVDANNQIRHWLTSKVPIVADEKVRYIVTTSLDVTAAKAREEELRQAQKMEAVGRLTGGIAHDFNNLLAVINGNILFIRRNGSLDADATQYLNAIETAAKLGTSLTGELLAFSRPGELTPSLIDLPTLIEDMQSSLFRTLPASIDIRTDFDENLKCVYTDRQQLQNALFNVALNARDAMPDGGVMEVRLRNRETIPGITSPNEAGWVEIEFADTGVGIAKDELDKVFEPFFTTKPAGAGSGLGMSMVHRFVNAAGGHVRIDSTEGVGTAIRISLPANPPSEEPKVAIRDVGETAPGGTETLLVVEDDAGVRLLATRALGELGYTVLEAANGTEGLELLMRDASIALLLSDIELGGPLDGFELARRARRISPDIKVLFCSGHATRDDRMVEGARMIAKPFHVDDLARIVAETLAQSQ